MMVHMNGFVLELDPMIGLDKVLSLATKRQGKFISYWGIQRVYYLKDFGDYIGGIFVTSRDQRSYTAMSHDGEDFQITVETVGGEEEEAKPENDVEAAGEIVEGSVSSSGRKKIADFNIFLFSKNGKKTKDGKMQYRGIYQYYDRSMTAGQFGGFLNSNFYQVAKNAKLKAEMGNLKMPFSEYKKKFVDRLTAAPLMEKRDFHKLVDSLREITMTEHLVSVLEPLDEAEPDKGVPTIKTFRTTYEDTKIMSESYVKRVKNWLNSLEEGKDGTKDARVRGKYASGKSDWITLSEVAVKYDADGVKYDEFLKGMNFRPSQFEMNAYFINMAAQAHSRGIITGK